MRPTYYKGSHQTTVHGYINMYVYVRTHGPTPADAQVALYSKIKTLPKCRTQKWHLSNAAWAPSKHAQNHQHMNDGTLMAMVRVMLVRV